MRLLERLRGRVRVGKGELRPARDVLSAEKDGVAVLLDLRKAVYIGLDEVGTTAWREIERGTTPDRVTERICEQFDAPAPAVQADMLRFIDELRRKRLVVNA